jgi:hypothetical protein
MVSYVSGDADFYGDSMEIFQKSCNYAADMVSCHGAQKIVEILWRFVILAKYYRVICYHLVGGLSKSNKCSFFPVMEIL